MDMRLVAVRFGLVEQLEGCMGSCIARNGVVSHTKMLAVVWTKCVDLM
jgi:hypothetical protein